MTEYRISQVFNKLISETLCVPLRIPPRYFAFQTATNSCTVVLNDDPSVTSAIASVPKTEYHLGLVLQSGLLNKCCAQNVCFAVRVVALQCLAEHSHDWLLE